MLSVSSPDSDIIKIVSSKLQFFLQIIALKLIDTKGFSRKRYTFKYIYLFVFSANLWSIFSILHENFV